MREKLLEIIEPAVRSLGYELVEVEFNSHGRGGTLRVFIDNEAGITLDDCEKASHQISGVLDVEDPIPGAYSLEVSSPGLDRPLRTAEDYGRFAGRLVKIEADRPIDGRRRFKGTLHGIESGQVKVDVDGRSYAVPLERIARARLVPEI